MTALGFQGATDPSLPSWRAVLDLRKYNALLARGGSAPGAHPRRRGVRRPGGDFGEEPQRAVDWDGAGLEVPEMGLLHRVGHRMTGKQPRRLAAVAAAVPLGDRGGVGDSPERARKAVELPEEVHAPSGGLAPPAGMVWVVVDPSLTAVADWGRTTDLPAGSVVLGAKAIRAKGPGDLGRVPGWPGPGMFCELMVIGEVPDRLVALRELYKGISEPIDGTKAEDAEWPLPGEPRVAGKAAPSWGGAEPDWLQGPSTPVYDISEDVRTLAVEWDSQGVRYKDFKKAVNESSEQSIEDAELQGGQTALYSFKKMVQRGGDPKGWLLEFSRENQLGPKDRTWHELQTLTLAVHLAGTHDALNLGGLACIEALARRVTAIAEAHRGGPGTLPKWESTRHILGVDNPFQPHV